MDTSSSLSDDEISADQNRSAKEIKNNSQTRVRGSRLSLRKRTCENDGQPDSHGKVRKSLFSSSNGNTESNLECSRDTSRLIENNPRSAISTLSPTVLKPIVIDKGNSPGEVITQALVSGNEYSGFDATDNNINVFSLSRISRHDDSRTQLQKCNISPYTISDDSCDSPKLKTHVDSLNISGTGECQNLKTSTLTNTKKVVNQISNEDSSYQEKQTLCEPRTSGLKMKVQFSQDVKEYASLKRVANETSHASAAKSSSKQKNETFLVTTTEQQEHLSEDIFLREDNKSCHESQCNTSDIFSLAKSLIKHLDSNRLSQLIKVSVSSQKRQQNSVIEEIIIISSDEESDEVNHPQPVQINQREESVSKEKTSALTCRTSASSVKLNKCVSGERKENRAKFFLLQPKIEKYFPVFGRSRSYYSLSQDVPYQGEYISKKVNQIQDNSDLAMSKLVTTLSNISTNSIPSVHRKSTGFYENVCDEDSPPVLSQDLITIHKTSSEESSSLSMYSPMNSEVGYSGKERNTDNVLDQLVLQHEQAPSGVPHLNAIITSPTGAEGSNVDLDHLAVVKKEESCNDVTDTGSAYVYSEISDEIYVLDSDDDEFFMSQSIQGTSYTYKEKSGQVLNSNEKRVKINANNSHTKTESDFEVCAEFKQLVKSEVLPKKDTTCSGEVESLRISDAYNNLNGRDTELDNDQSGNDTDNLDDETAPLAPLLEEKWTSYSEQSSKNTKVTKCVDVPSNNVDETDNSNLKCELSKSVKFTDDLTAESAFNDDDDVFLSQMDMVDDVYFAHTQVDYMAHSDEELEHDKDGADHENINVAENNVMCSDSASTALDSDKKVKQPILHSKYLSNKASSASSSVATCDVIDPYCRDTQVNLSSEEKDLDGTFAVAVSLDEDTQVPDYTDAAEKQNPYVQETLAVSEALNETEDQDPYDRQTLAVSEDTQDSTENETDENSQGTVKDKDKFERITVASSPKQCFENVYNMSTQKFVLPETEHEGLNNREQLAASPSSSDDSDCFLSMATQRSFQPEATNKNLCDNETEENFQITPSNNQDPLEQKVITSSNKDLVSFYNMATQKSPQSEIGKDNPYSRGTLAVCEELNADTQDPFEIMTLRSSPSSEIESVYNMPTQKIVLSETQNQDLYNRETLAVAMESSEDTQDPYDRETLAVAMEYSEDTQDPYVTEAGKISHVTSKDQDSFVRMTPTASTSKDKLGLYSMSTKNNILSEIRNHQDQDEKKTLAESLARDMDIDFHAQTQKDFSSLTEQIQPLKEMTVVPVPQIGDEECSEDSEGLLSIKTQKDSSSLNDDIQDPFSMDTQTDSLSGIKDDRIGNGATSSQHGNYMGPFSVETIIDYSPDKDCSFEDESPKCKETPAVSPILCKDNQFLIQTKKNAKHVLYLRPNDKETDVISSRGDHDPSKELINSDFQEESQDCYLLSTQVDYSYKHPQERTHKVNSFSMTSTPVKLMQAQRIINVQKDSHPAKEQQDPFVSETLVDSTLLYDYKQEDIEVLSCNTQDGHEDLQSNRTTKGLNKETLAFNLLQNIKKNKALFNTKLLSKLSVLSSQEIQVTGEINSATQNLQSPYFVKIGKDSKKDSPSVKEYQNLHTKETLESTLSNRGTKETFSKQVQVIPSSVTDDTKPIATFLPIEKLNNTETNMRTLAESSCNSEVSKKCNSYENGIPLEAACNLTYLNQWKTRNSEVNIFSDYEKILFKPEVKEDFIQNAVTSTSLKIHPKDKHLTNEQPKGEAVTFNTQNNVSCFPAGRSLSSSVSSKRHAVKNNEKSAKRQCLKEADGYGVASSNDAADRKQINKNFGRKNPTCNLTKVMVTSVEENPSTSSWLSAGKGKNSNNKHSIKFNSVRNNILKPKRQKTKSTETAGELISLVEKAKQTQQKRLKGFTSAKPAHDRQERNSVLNVHDDNDDVEMPSTQDMMSLGLPILSAKLPVSKKHLARGLPSQGRLASEEKDKLHNLSQKPDERISDKGTSTNVNKNSIRKDMFPPVPIFNHTAVASNISHENTTFPAPEVVTLEISAAGTSSSSESNKTFIKQPLMNATYHHISESEPNKQMSHSQAVTTFRPPAVSVESLQNAVPISAQPVISVSHPIFVSSAAALHRDKITLSGPVLQTLPHLKMATNVDSSSSKGILKTSKPHQTGGKTVSKVNFSDSHYQQNFGGNTNCTMPQTDVLQLKEVPKSKPEAKLYFLSTLLKWNPAWLKEREIIQSLPELFGSQNKITEVCSQLRMFYSTFHEYVDITLKLLILECWETIFRDWKMCMTQPSMQLKQLEVHCVSNPSHPYKEPEGCSLINIDVIGLIPQQDRRKIPSNGDLLIIDFWGARKVQKNYEEPRLNQQFAVVKSVGVENTNLKVLLQAHKILESSSALRGKNPVLVKMRLLLQHKGIIITPSKMHKIQAISSLKIIERQVDALIKLPESPLCVHLLKPCSGHVFSHQNVQPDAHLSSKLNREQATAVATILKEVAGNTSSQKVFLLQGPPGTGKSHTILALIHKILVKTNFSARICLATPSNAAVDEIAKRIINFSLKLERKALHKISLVRVGNSTKVDPQVKKFMLDNLVEQRLTADVPESLRSELNLLEREALELKESLANPSLTKDQEVMKIRKQKENETKIIKLKKDMVPKRSNFRERHGAKCQILDGAHVICGTLNSLGSDELKEIILRSEEHSHKRRPFTCLIIDEATQAIEVDCLIPLQYKMSKIVLVGDHEQLPATVMSQMATEKCFGRSLFERMDLCIKNFSQGNTSSVMMLTRQYRMHSEILYLPNSFFYDNQLITDGSVLARKEVIAPYLVFDIQESRETRAEHNRSVSNVDEAICTAQLYEIVKQKMNKMNTIGVICPYADQRCVIERCLKEKNLNIEVNTVDSFQGQERDVIILSCVRAQSSPSGIGFLADRKRMNVALTRARHALYIIGHFNTLKTDELWEQLFKNALERKLLVNVKTTADFKNCAEGAVLKKRL